MTITHFDHLIVRLGAPCPGAGHLAPAGHREQPVLICTGCFV